MGNMYDLREPSRDDMPTLRISNHGRKLTSQLCFKVGGHNNDTNSLFPQES